MAQFSSQTEKQKSAVFLAKNLILVTFAALSIGGCASGKSGEIQEGGLTIQDPFEDTNRKIMAFNLAADKAVINPVIRGYRTVAPKPVRTSIDNVLKNLRSPINFTNEILQGDIEGAGNILSRTIINSTLGIGGLFDLAGYEGIEYEPEDFGQTLAIWGVGHGPYFVLPLIGPSSLRDYSGYLVDSAADPFRLYLSNIDEDGIYYAKFGLDYLSIRDSLMDTLLEVERGSIDYYAAIRSIYYQHRANIVNDVKTSMGEQVVDIPDYDE